jgi:hypothetical protein
LPISFAFAFLPCLCLFALIHLFTLPMPLRFSVAFAFTPCLCFLHCLCLFTLPGPFCLTFAI